MNKHNVTCPYCGNDAKLVGGVTIYPHRPNLYEKKFWYCDNGHPAAYVGCHKNSKTHAPLGRLADAELRGAKKAAHAAFDPLWKSGKMKRQSAYKWLANELGIPGKLCHIGMFDVTQCRNVVAVCTKAEF